MPVVRRQVRMMRRRGRPTPGRVQPARGPDARSVAHAVLLRVETTAAFADVLLARAVGGLPARTSSFITEASRLENAP